MQTDYIGHHLPPANCTGKKTPGLYQLGVFVVRLQRSFNNSAFDHEAAQEEYSASGAENLTS
ncbi:hypothetical protein PCCS19_31290 [Paenibacillus sp. CCS19]|nr:hypothetical protein PCCS19_31290 [Paenibacillus cellulosilyticus]